LTTSCCAAWCPLHQVVLFDLVCMVLGCLIFSASCCRLISPASCYAAWSSLNHVMLLDLVFIMPRCLIVSTSCYAAEPSLPYVMFLGVPCLMLCCLILSSRRYAAWSFLPRATFLTFLCYVACVLYILLSFFLYGLHAATPPDLLFLLLDFSGIPTSCDAAFCIILCYSVSPSWCYAAWFPTSNYAAWPSLTDVMLLHVLTSDRVTLFGLVFMMLCCLVLSTSCLATKRMNFISIGFSTQNYSGSTSFSCLASAAWLVAISGFS